MKTPSLRKAQTTVNVIVTILILILCFLYMRLTQPLPMDGWAFLGVTALFCVTISIPISFAILFEHIDQYWCAVPDTSRPVKVKTSRARCGPILWGDQCAFRPIGSQTNPTLLLKDAGFDSLPGLNSEALALAFLREVEQFEFPDGGRQLVPMIGRFSRVPNGAWVYRDKKPTDFPWRRVNMLTADIQLLLQRAICQTPVSTLGMHAHFVGVDLARDDSSAVIGVVAEGGLKGQFVRVSHLSGPKTFPIPDHRGLGGVLSAEDVINTQPLGCPFDEKLPTVTREGWLPKPTEPGEWLATAAASSDIIPVCYSANVVEIQGQLHVIVFDKLDERYHHVDDYVAVYVWRKKKEGE